MGAITRADEVILFDPQKYTGEGTSPMYSHDEFLVYCHDSGISEVHYMVLGTWKQQERLQMTEEPARKRIKLEIAGQ